MRWHEAVEEDAAGCRVLVETLAGARQAVFPAGFNPWRGRITARVHAPARQGLANEELVGLVAAFFAVPRDAVDIVSGHRASHKTLRVGLGRPAAIERLASHLD